MEEQYLRDELNMRLSGIYSHSNSTITFVITVWSALVALISVFYERFQNNLEWLTFIIPFVFLLTSFYIFFAAQKFRESLTQINKIGTYYACFYNSSLSKESKKTSTISWEYSTLEFQVTDLMKKSNTQRVLTHMNGEYVFFSIVSLLIEIIIIGAGLYFWRSDNKLILGIATYLIVILGINIALICKIYQLTSLSHITEERLELMYRWIEYAQNKGFYTEKEASERFETILDAYQRSMESKKHRHSKKKTRVTSR